MPPTPPRKFAPTPISETRSSRKRETPKEEENKAKPRRFAPEPIEETTRSSKEPRTGDVQHEVRPKPRRFAPESVEHTVKSSKDARAAEVEKPTPRRFAPQVVEETHKSSKDKEGTGKKGVHVKFGPEPAVSKAVEEQQTKPQPRKFTPILLDTATRSRKVGDPNPGLSQEHRTEYAYHLHHKEHWNRVTGAHHANEPEPEANADEDVEMDSDDTISESSANYSASSQLREPCATDGTATKRPACLIPARQHSFRMPELDTIDSSESERDSNPSPLSSSPNGADGSPITASDTSLEYFKHATRIRESVDESFTHYLLDIERKKMEERLREQALAAFPNPDFGYEPPDHYVNNDDDEDEEIEDRPVTWEGFEDEEDMVLDLPPTRRPRKDSTEDVAWEQMEAQRHAEEMQQERNAARITAKAPSAAVPPSSGPFVKFPEIDGKDPKDVSPELKSMRACARPPMLGADLVFPRCQSPEPARFDVTQGSTALRNQMCYLTEAAEYAKKRSGEDGGLWGAGGSTIKSPVAASSPKSAASSTKGLWGGFCVDEGDENAPKRVTGLAPPGVPTGLRTPKADGPNPYDLAFTATEGRPVDMRTPPMPPRTKDIPDARHLDAVLNAEREFEAQMEQEFPDSFVTQVYNYLSLGYPSLARDFDEELAKISRISIAELRQDDKKAKANPRGYIRLGSDFEGGGGEGLEEQSCMRWQALKRYIREWARQERERGYGDGVGGNWGTGARRGSWAI